MKKFMVLLLCLAGCKAEIESRPNAEKPNSGAAIVHLNDQKDAYLGSKYVASGQISHEEDTVNSGDNEYKFNKFKLIEDGLQPDETLDLYLPLLSTSKGKSFNNALKMLSCEEQRVIITGYLAEFGAKRSLFVTEIGIAP